MDFYTTAAQVIPVLYLAIAFEARLLDREPVSYVDQLDMKEMPRTPAMWNMSGVVLSIYVVIVMGLGELAALIGVGVGRPAEWLTRMIWIGLVVGLLGIGYPPLARQFEYLSQWQKADMGWLVVWLVGGLLAFMTVIALSWPNG